VIAQQTIVFGVPVPSDDKVFISIVVVHILLGIVCVVTGAVAMLSNKGRGTHSLAGKVYYWVLLLIFLTVVSLSIMRWPHNNHLLVLGALSYLSAYGGRWLARQQRTGWPRLHTICMGASYILLLTAFYVDNGKNLPFWRQFSQLFFWIFPSAIGILIILYALYRHPLNRVRKNVN
jgi:uncharacterized membrane protein